MALKVGLLLSGSSNLLKGQPYSHFTQQQQQEHPPIHPHNTPNHMNNSNHPKTQTHPQTHNTQLHE